MLTSILDNLFTDILVDMVNMEIIQLKVIGCSSLRGGGGELSTNKNLDLWLQLVCIKLKLKTCYLDVQLGCSSVKPLSQKSLATYSLSYQETIL